MDKVRPGDPLRISAEYINQTLDTNELVRRYNLSPPGLGSPCPPGIVAVRNDSGSARKALDPIYVSGYAAATTDPRSIPVLVGKLDTSLPHWGICMESIAADEVGRVQVSGVAAARLTVLDATHTTVAISKTTWALETAATGDAALLGAANGYGTIILAVPSGSGGSGILFAQITGLDSDNLPSGTCALRGSIYAAPAGGTALATDATIMVYGVTTGTLLISDFDNAPRLAAVFLGQTTWDGNTGDTYALLNTLHALVP